MTTPIKACKDCKYVKASRSGWEFAKCSHPDVAELTKIPDYVLGIENIKYKYVYCYKARQATYGYPCGPLGKCFEQKEPKLSYTERFNNFYEGVMEWINLNK